ncbi:hypothetical protein ACFL1H_05900, partial [Nanoarchaeota archaeon]
MKPVAIQKLTDIIHICDVIDNFYGIYVDSVKIKKMMEEAGDKSKHRIFNYLNDDNFKFIK